MHAMKRWLRVGIRISPLPLDGGGKTGKALKQEEFRE
jgi:hypothetical protein